MSQCIYTKQNEAAYSPNVQTVELLEHMPHIAKEEWLGGRHHRGMTADPHKSVTEAPSVYLIKQNNMHEKRQASEQHKASLIVDSKAFRLCICT